jgi:hypothetical protein
MAALVAEALAGVAALPEAVWAKPDAAQNRPMAIANARMEVFIVILSKWFSAMHNHL